MTRSMLIAAVAALIGGAALGTANAAVSHIYGNGGKHYTFDSVCHRVTVLPPGITDHEALNIAGQQIQCLVQREARIRSCFRHVVLEAKYDHGPAKPADWLGVDTLKECGSL